jgi:hypothetical protein
MLALSLWSLFAAAGIIGLPADKNTVFLYGGIGAGGMLLLLILIALLRRDRSKINPESGLAEDLSKIPAPAKGPRHYQLLAMSQPVRLRLVVVAPVGKKVIGKVDSVLEQIFRGLGEVCLDDKPRVRLWPAQFSTAGFAPTFFRLTRRPEPAGKPSRWILLAGPARAGGTPVLLGLAVFADTPSTAGLVTVDETQWSEILRVENT